VSSGPLLRATLHIDPDTGIRCSPVTGHPVSVLAIGKCFDIFGTPEDLARIATVITVYLSARETARELTVVRDPAEAERFRLECERDAKGEDE
jgi:hypothetical protein